MPSIASMWEDMEVFTRPNCKTSEIVVVKKFKEAVGIEIASRKAFKREIHALTEARHQNIIKLYAFCLSSRHHIWCMSSWNLVA